MDIKKDFNLFFKEKETNTICKFKSTRLLPDSIQIGLFSIDKIGNVEFRPFINNYNGKTLRFKVQQIKAVIKYRYLYKYKALNIFLHNSKRSKVFDFDEESYSNDIYDYLIKYATNIDSKFDDLEYHSKLWVNGLLSNFDYLMALNILASRSFNDISQYPVFPWILSNYNSEILDLSDENNYRDLSKPMGAINPHKLAQLKQNYNEKILPDALPYLYGTLYSNPQLITYYLVRSLPLLQIKFQTGRFDSPDRLFNNINEAYNITFTSTQDFKELIPEFYNSEGEFLVNQFDLNLGKIQSGEKIGNVVLPAWAKSPSMFINIMRAALESDYVSNHLNEWIDLIFGYKQNGEEAEKADNVFFYTTYESYKYEMFNPVDRKNNIYKIIELGQTPKQLFSQPHPSKKAKNSILLKVHSLLHGKNTKEDVVQKIDFLVNENEKLEKELERIRRSKELNKEKIIDKYEEINRKRKNKIRSLKNSLILREEEFRQIVANLLEQNTNLRMNFDIYDKSKDEFFNQQINEIRKKQEDDIKAQFSDKYMEYSFIKNLETAVDKRKVKEINNQHKIDTLKENTDHLEYSNKCLKEELFSLQKKIRKLPPEKQIYISSDDKKKETLKNLKIKCKDFDQQN